MWIHVNSPESTWINVHLYGVCFYVFMARCFCNGIPCPWNSGFSIWLVVPIPPELGGKKQVPGPPPPMRGICQAIYQMSPEVLGLPPTSPCDWKRRSVVPPDFHGQGVPLQNQRANMIFYLMYLNLCYGYTTSSISFYLFMNLFIYDLFMILFTWYDFIYDLIY
jgi:hypothetical protein